MRSFKNTDEAIRSLRKELDRIETQVKAVRGDGGVSNMYGNVDLHGGRCINASPSREQNDYVTRGELEEAMGNQLKTQVFASSGTTHDLTYKAESADAILMFVNGALMEKDATGNLGYTVDLDGGTGGTTRITSNRSFATTDYRFVLYVKEAF